MILLYTYEGGVKTIVYTDTLQTSCMLAGLIICVVYLLNQMDMSFSSSLTAMGEQGYSKIFFTDPSSKYFFLKQILAGAFITITMTGMDQEMMQKNISVKTLGGAQKNVITLGVILMAVLLLFLFLGGVLLLYANQQGITATGDQLFPEIALKHMPPIVSVIFIIALISALFPSADGAITALTSSFCIDIIGMQRNQKMDDGAKKKLRQRVHLTFALLFLILVMVYKWINEPSMIGVILKVAAYTYGPLLGLFTFGILTKRLVNDRLVPLVCVAAPVLCFFIDKFQKQIFGSFEVGLELLVINGLLTFIGLLVISYKPQNTSAMAE
jgi:Na+/proline symporter